MRNRLLSGLLSVSLWLPGLSAAQETQPADTPAGRMMNAFERSAPAVGGPLPDISVYDSEGNPYRIGQLKGQYSVLVFGCLT